MEQDRITLKAIKQFEAQSHETHCYTASLYFDGKRVGQVGNSGYGGPDHVTGTVKERYEAMQAYIKTLPVVPFSYHKAGTLVTTELEQDLDIICGHLVNAFLRRRVVSKMTKGGIAYYEGTFNGAYSKCMFGPLTEEEIRDHIKATTPNAVILNDLSDSELTALLPH